MEQVIDFSKLRTLEEIRAAFDKLKCEEDRTEKDLESILASHKKIESELKELVQCGQYSCVEKGKGGGWSWQKVCRASESLAVLYIQDQLCTLPKHLPLSQTT